MNTQTNSQANAVGGCRPAADTTLTLKEAAKEAAKEAEGMEIYEKALRGEIGKEDALFLARHPHILFKIADALREQEKGCLLYTSPSPRDRQKSRMPSSA